MEEFLKNNYSLLTKTVEIIAAITAVFVYKRYSSTNIKYFLWFLVYIAILELIGGYPKYIVNYEFLKPIRLALEGTLFIRNYWLYNIFWATISPLFYAFYFMLAIERKLFKKIIKVTMVLFIILASSKIIIDPTKLFTNTIVANDIMGATLVFISVILFFIEMLQSEKILNFYKSINFYIAAIVFIWFLVLTPLDFYNIYFSTADWDFIILKWQIYLSMNFFMYISFSIALLWCRPQKN